AAVRLNVYPYQHAPVPLGVHRHHDRRLSGILRSLLRCPYCYLITTTRRFPSTVIIATMIEPKNVSFSVAVPGMATSSGLSFLEKAYYPPMMTKRTVAPNELQPTMR